MQDFSSQRPIRSQKIRLNGTPVAIVIGGSNEQKLRIQFNPDSTADHLNLVLHAG
jgi:hypothetical protein